MIPRRIHYVWVGGKLPDHQKKLIDGWRRLNPEYEFICWNEDNIDFGVPAIQRAYQEKRWSKVADIVRLKAVHAQGGIYLDTDIDLRKSLDPLLDHSCFWSFQIEHHLTDWVCNGVFGAEAGHWFVKEVLDHVLQLRPVPFGLERPTRTGPKLLTALLRKHGLRSYDPQGVQIQGMFILPYTVFFPQPMGEAFNEDNIKPDTIGVHLWEKSWAKDLPRLVRWAIYAKARLRAAG